MRLYPAKTRPDRTPARIPRRLALRRVASRAPETRMHPPNVDATARSLARSNRSLRSHRPRRTVNPAGAVDQNSGYGGPDESDRKSPEGIEDGEHEAVGDEESKVPGGDPGQLGAPDPEDDEEQKGGKSIPPESQDERRDMIGHGQMADENGGGRKHAALARAMEYPRPSPKPACASSGASGPNFFRITFRSSSRPVGGFHVAEKQDRERPG